MSELDARIYGDGNTAPSRDLVEARLRARVAELEKALDEACACADNPDAWNWYEFRKEWLAVLRASGNKSGVLK